MSGRELLDLPQHVNPSVERTASAPYNFVPLPEVVVTAVKSADRLPHHDTYANEGYPHSGCFEVTLTTQSPLYVRGMLSAKRKPGQDQSEFEQAEAEKMGQTRSNTDFRRAMKNKPEFFNTGNQEQPVIPGSSLRGMLRGLLEIVSYGKVQWVSQKKLFFRTVDNTAVGIHYRGRMVQERSGQREVMVRSGFLRWEQGEYFIKTCRVVRVPHAAAEDYPSVEVGDDLYEGHGPMKTPRWNGQPHQHQACWVKLNEKGRLEQLAWDKPSDEKRWSQGRLVITGDMQGKLAEFIFLLPETTAERITVAETVIERFHDDDQISQWQQRAFRKDTPAHNSRERDGMLPRDLSGEGEPVFFLCEQTEKAAGRPEMELTFIGRARMFRLPYQQRPIDLIPPELRNPDDIDFAEALFGYVKPRKKHADDEEGVDAPQGDKRRAYAGRVFVTDAALDSGQSEVLHQVLVPRILASPKPTAFQQYLVQPADRKDSLKHYDSDSPRETVLRGHKLYWRQGTRTEQDLLPKPGELNVDDAGRVDPKSTQHTQLQPVKSGVRFTFRVYFENLSDKELGALCWTLHPLGDSAQTYCHSLGMGKPLGMGAVQLDAVLHLNARAARYATLFDDDQWTLAFSTPQSLADRHVLEERVQAFEQAILEALKLYPAQRHLYEVRRIALLLKMLEWPGYAPQTPATSTNRVVKGRDGQRPNTRTMLVQLNEGGRRMNEFRDRYVLPDPAAFGRLTGEVTVKAADSDKGSSANARSTNRVYVVGDVFTGPVVQLFSNGGVAVVIPDVDPEQGYAVIAAADLAGKVFKVGNLARCEVKRIGHDKKNRTMYHCRPAEKQSK